MTLMQTIMPTLQRSKVLEFQLLILKPQKATDKYLDEMLPSIQHNVENNYNSLVSMLEAELSKYYLNELICIIKTKKEQLEGLLEPASDFSVENTTTRVYSDSETGYNSHCEFTATELWENKKDLLDKLTIFIDKLEDVL